MAVRSNSQTTFVTDIKGKFKNNIKTIPISSSERQLLLILVDALVVVLAFRGAILLLQQATDAPPGAYYLTISWGWFPILLAGWWILAWFNDLYDVPSSTDGMLSLIRVVVACFLGLLAYGATLFVTMPPSTRLFFGYFLLLLLPLVSLWRWTYAKVFSTLPFRQRVIIVSSGERGRSIVNALKQKPLGNYQILGYVDDHRAEPGTLVDDLPILGREADLPFLVEELQVNEIIVAKQHSLQHDSFRCLINCQALGVRLTLMPDLHAQLYRRIPIEHIDPNWALQAMQGKAGTGSFQQAVKRLIDIALAAMGIAILLPVFPLLALVICLDSPGPILYRQIRSGKAGKLFTIIKLRTMYVDAEKDGKARWATERDPRITRVGYFLRKTRLDELPQLLNVFKGEMSIIGPRPERPEFVRELQQTIPYYQARLMVKPGLTGWAQIHYGYGNSIEDALVKLQYDFYYMRHWSLSLDLYIIFRTASVIFRFQGT